MSKAVGASVVEWSPTGVRAFDLASGKMFEGRSMADVAGKLSGPVILALSRRACFIRTTRLPDLAKADVLPILRHQLGGLFPLEPAEAAFDLVWTSDIGPEGRLALVSVVRSTHLREAKSDAQAAGINVERVVPAALGSWMLAKRLNFENGAIVERDPDGLSIDIVQGGILRATRVGPLPRAADDIEAEISRTFAVAKMNTGDVLAAGGLVYGDAAQHVENSTLRELSDVAVGEYDFSFEPPEDIVRRQQAKVIRSLRLALVTSGAALFALTYVGLSRMDAAKAVRQTDGKRRAELRRVEGLRNTMKTRLQKEERIVATLDRALRPAQRFTDVMAALAGKLPKDLWITGANLERGKLMQVRGTAKSGESVTKLVQILEVNPRFRDAKLAFVNNATIEGTAVVQFAISFHAVGNLPLVEAKKKTTRKAQ